MHEIYRLPLPGFGCRHTTFTKALSTEIGLVTSRDCLQEDNLEIRLDESPGELPDSPEHPGGFCVHSRKMDGPLGGDGKFSPGDICKEVHLLPPVAAVFLQASIHEPSEGLLCAAPELCAMRVACASSL